MKKKMMARLVGAALAVAAAPASAAESAAGQGNVEFKPLVVSGDALSDEQRALEKPGAVSSRGENTKLQSLDSILRGIPGTYTQIDPGQGAVSVNIRGLSGLGRVNTMIDGVSQNYYGSAPSSLSHGAAPSSSFGALIDPNFIVGVDVTRGTGGGASGVNALAGSANFRTLGVEDVIFDGQQQGARLKYSVGSNGLGRSGMAAGAARTELAPGVRLGLLGAISSSSIGGNYRNAQGVDSEAFGFGYDEHFTQNPQSQMLKANLRVGDVHEAELSARRYRNNFVRRDIQSDDFYLKYNYTPHSEWLDFSVLASHGRGRQAYQRGSLFSFYNSSTDNIGDALEARNSSRFSLAGGDATLSVGGKWMRNRFTRNVNSMVQSTDDNPDANQQAIENNIFAPAGRQEIRSLFTGLEFRRGIYTLQADLNYSRFALSGHKPACDPRVECFPQGAADIKLEESAFNPSLLLSAEIKPWFQPFASYARTMRGPNPQEVFFANSGGQSMNPFLKSERAETYQLGVTSMFHGLLSERDTLRTKALFYRSRIADYISSQAFNVCKGGRKCTLDEFWSNSSDDYNDGMTIYTNSLTPVRTRGFELEADYDAGFVYARLSYSREHTSQPTSFASGMFSVGNVSELPDEYYTLDLGSRWLERKLEVGALFKRDGANRRLSPDQLQDDSTSAYLKEEQKANPVIIDLYASYRVNKQWLIRAGVRNLANRSYSEPLNTLNSLPSQSPDISPNSTARGRSYMLATELRF
ncbi:TonB-dependent receptor domain-containing protein [Chromobacterium sp. Beijing]|uniref:TonB-dependent receptor domain-containing protein n=1 Tax=Chromobacterium sp. Beijing TaxID=2735795 RepID=UPI001F2247CD|nr:TonB-dependent receptor [Chromobacterium sp. Beijing]UJB31650.1 TonB-dependent receptor [Chromobacterium sp. Beijing]